MTRFSSEDRRVRGTHKKTYRTFDSTSIKRSLRKTSGIGSALCCIGWSSAITGIGTGRGILMGGVRVGWLPPCCQYLCVVPVVAVFLERSIERSELSIYDELGDDGVVPVFGARVDALWSEMATVDGVVSVRTTRRRSSVAHGVEYYEVRREKGASTKSYTCLLVFTTRGFYQQTSTIRPPLLADVLLPAEKLVRRDQLWFRSLDVGRLVVQSVLRGKHAQTN